jgi:DNA-binding MltR family transcriptional regulator
MTNAPRVTDEDVEVALRAMRDYFRELVSDSPLYEDELTKFFESLAAESSRALPIVAFSYIDEKLATLMRGHMNPGVSGGLDSLFNSFGPLSTASARIKMAAALNWLSPMTYRHLEILRKIRNAFAHRPFLNSFDESPVRDYLGQFEPAEKSLWSTSVADKLLPYDEVPLRQLFHMRATLTCARMIEEVTCAPRAISWVFRRTR